MYVNLFGPSHSCIDQQALSQRSNFYLPSGRWTALTETDTRHEVKLHIVCHLSGTMQSRLLLAQSSRKQRAHMSSVAVA